MPVSLLQYVQAKNLVLLTVAAASPNASGVLVVGGAVDISEAGIKGFVSFNVAPAQMLEQFRNSDSSVDNFLKEYGSWGASLSEMPYANGLSPTQIIIGGSDYIRVEAHYRAPWQTGTAGVKVAVLGLWESADLNIGSGNNPLSINIKPSGRDANGLSCFYMGLASGTIPF